MDALSENLKSEVSDFVDFLIGKAVQKRKGTKNAPVPNFRVKIRCPKLKGY
ncbi:MAG: hypothetical protein ACM3SY_02775 [Candidatus Omnitrophota bacterium]